jgi:hypothetical protein
MRRTRYTLAFLLTAATALAGSPSAAQQDAESVEPVQTPSFLKTPPQSVLRQGLQPLAAELPDTSVREGLMPPDLSHVLFDDETVSASVDRGSQWTPMDFHWVPSELRYQPTYFEDTMLERHGQRRHPLIQPLASGSRFFLTIPALPYAAAVNPPCRPTCPLGHFRVGSGAPCLCQRPPLQVDAGLLEAGLVLGTIFIVP